MLQLTVDKFTFRVAADRLYTAQGVWVLAGDGLVTLGVSDFFQQHHGDVAFAEVLPAGPAVSAGDPFANIETIKADIELAAPFSGTIAAANEALELEAELINQDPYGGGWLVDLRPDHWPPAGLLDAERYLAVMTKQALSEAAS